MLLLQTFQKLYLVSTKGERLELLQHLSLNAKEIFERIIPEQKAIERKKIIAANKQLMFGYSKLVCIN